jgi:formylglycine-generating enzyme required for sulfatase activity
MPHSVRIEKPIDVRDPKLEFGPWLVSRPEHRLLPTPKSRMGIFPIRNVDFAAFIRDGAYRDSSLWDGKSRTRFYICGDGSPGPATWSTGSSIPQGRELYPVAGICYYEAEAFCRWLNRAHPEPGWEWGLPTEDMWEYVARFGRNSAPTLYPWGNGFEKDRCNSVEAGWNATTPVGMFPQGSSAHGCMDMAGNVWEFVSAVVSDDFCILRGGSFKNKGDEVQSCLRLQGVPRSHRADDFGFRCALVESSDPISRNFSGGDALRLL